jgi:rhamnose utilization protein RhaD (predicted bifunctional aldolase and dehydrogenase)
MKILDELVELSHEFGTEDYVQVGGGNSSVKNETSMWIKPSGMCLREMTADGFLEIDRSKMAALYNMTPPEESDEREALVTSLLMETRARQDSPYRPSVETPLHDSLQAAFVIHTHPQLIGGLVAASDSEAASKRLFPDCLYCGMSMPGYILQMQIRTEVAAYREKTGKEPTVILMENHGLIVAGNTPDEVRSLHEHVMGTLAAAYGAAGIPTKLEVGPKPKKERIEEITNAVRSVCDGEDTTCSLGTGRFNVAAGPISPDHIVYMNSYAFFGEPSKESLSEFTGKYGYAPRIVVTDDAVVALGADQRNTERAMILAKDGAVVARLTDAFGGIRYMGDAQREFIENWEVEAYRRKLA